MIEARQDTIIKSGSPEQTEAIGGELSRMLKSGDLISLTGPLGAGKTCLIKGIATAFGRNKDDISSPTYTLINEYPGIPPIFHFDLYRLDGEADLYGIGWDEYLMRDGITVVEWGEKAGKALPEHRINIEIRIISESEREIDIRFI